MTSTEPAVTSSEHRPAGDTADSGPAPRARAGRGSLPFMVLLGVTAVLNSGFQVIAARGLGPAGFSAIAALLTGLGAVFSVVVSGAQTAIARTISEAPDPRRVPLRVLWRRSAVASVVGGGAVCVAAPVINTALGVDNLAASALLGAWLAVNGLQVVGKAALSATWRTTGLGIALVVSAVARLAAAMIAIGLFGVTGGLAASVLGELVLVVVMRWMLRDNCRPAAVATPRTAWGDALAAGLVQLGFWLLIGSWTILARARLEPVDAGILAAAATVGTAGVFLPAGLTTILYPRMTRGLYRSALLAGLGWASAIAVATVAGVAAFGPQATRLVFGDAYTPDRVTAVAMAVAGGACGIMLIAEYALLARRDPGALMPWVATAAAIIGAQWMDFAQSLAIWLAICCVVACAVVVARAFDIAVLRRPERRDGVGLDGDGTVPLSVVIPAYNPGRGLERVVAGALAACADAGGGEVIVVDDCSPDGMPAGLVAGYADGRAALPDHTELRLVSHETNAGKGAALLSGFAVAQGRVVALIDADGDIDAGYLPVLSSAVRGDVWAACGTKLGAGGGTLLRRTVSAGWRGLVRALFDVTLTDTQVGIKAFRRSALREVLTHTRTTGYTFDLELLAYGHRLGLGDIVAVPVTIERQGASTVRARSVVVMFAEALRLWNRLAVEDPGPRDVDAATRMVAG